MPGRGGRPETKERARKRECERAKGTSVPEPPRVPDLGWPETKHSEAYQLTARREADERFDGSKNFQPSNITLRYGLHVTEPDRPV